MSVSFRVASNQFSIIPQMNLSFLDTPRSSIGKDPAPTGNGQKLILPPPPTGAGMDRRDSITKSSGDDDSTMATPRSQHTKDEYDDPDIDDMLNPDKDDGNKVINAIGKFVNKQAKAFVKNFVDYGPPYTKKPFDATLVMECSRPVMNHLELHRQLNNRLDPNIPDPDDLYYYPIHWCARNIHFAAMKMLRRAGAKVNVTNELGCSPLDMCVMMKIPPDKRKDQLKMVKYLLENGADPNNRDKGGYSAIDQAAINQDLELIQMLLEYGANVLRENHTLVAKRHHILKNVYEPAVYKVLYEQLLLEQSEYERRQIIREKLLSEVAAERHHVKLFQSLDRRKQKRLDREKSRDQTAKLTAVMEQRHKHLQEEMEANLKNREKAIQFQGVWTKDDVDHWSFRVKSQADRINSDTLYKSNLHTMNTLHNINSVDKYNERWKSTTGSGVLELHWTKADPFVLPPIPDTNTSNSTMSSVNMRAFIQNGIDGDNGSIGGSAGNSVGSKSKSVNKLSKGGKGITTNNTNNANTSNTASGSLTSSKNHDQLQLKSNKPTDSSSNTKEGAFKGGILKSNAHNDTRNSVTSNNSGSSNDKSVHSNTTNNNQSLTHNTNNTNNTNNANTTNTNTTTTHKYVPLQTSSNAAAYTLHDARGQELPIVDVKYADSDDQQLYDEDLEEMLRELTTF